MVSQPLMLAHSHENKLCRSVRESAQWLAAESAGQVWVPIRQTVAQLCDLGLLETAGLAIGGRIPGTDRRLLVPEHPAMIEQDRLASVVGGLSLSIAKFSTSTALLTTVCYPAAFFAILVEDKSMEVLERMRLHKDLHDRHLVGLNVPYWKKAMARSIFRDKFVTKARACSASTCRPSLQMLFRDVWPSVVFGFMVF